MVLNNKYGLIGLHLGLIGAVLYIPIALFYEKLGADPVLYIIHYFGKSTLNLLCLNMLLGPLTARLNLSFLFRYRRPLGLWTLAFATLHFLAWVTLDLEFSWGLAIDELIKRNYLFLGVTAWLMLAILGCISNQKAKNLLGAFWFKMHHLIYVIAILGGIHYYSSVKSDIVMPSIYLFVIALLIYERISRKPNHP